MTEHTARQAIIDYCERENVVNPMSAISIPYELVENLLVEYCTTLAEFQMLQKGLCGTNAELSTAWDKIDKLKASLSLEESLKMEAVQMWNKAEAEKDVLRKGIIHALQIPIGAVLDQHTRFALTDALKEGE